MHPARLWRPLTAADKAVQCQLCAHVCRILPGDVGRCGVRRNTAGQLETLVYDRVAALHLDPIEKKPLYHFLPGSTTLSLGTMGCNLECSFCQNWSLSQPPRQGRPVAGERLAPGDLVAAAVSAGAASLAYTYSEPTIFYELMADTAELALGQGLKNVMVSNGYMTRRCLQGLGQRIHAANIDLKAFSEEFYARICGARLRPVLDNLVTIRELGWWLEVTTLLIPGLNDTPDELRDMARWLVRELSPATPWHLSRFHPGYRLQDRPPTPVATLELAARIGREEGLEFVYVGNVAGHEANGTHCPGCGQLCLQRRGFELVATGLRQGACAGCGRPIPGVGLAELGKASG